MERKFPSRNFRKFRESSWGCPFSLEIPKNCVPVVHSSLWLNTTHFGIRSDEFENSYPCYKLFLNPGYVATRSLRSLHSNKSENSSFKELRSGLFIWKS